MKRILSTLLLGLSVTTASISPVLLPVAIGGLVVTQTACDEADLRKVENKLNQTANGLNTLAKTNRELYQSGIIKLETRQQVAGAINKANGVLGKAIDRAYQIKLDDAGSIQLGKDEVIELLNGVAADLQSLNIGNQELRIAIQATIALVNEATALTRRVRTN